MTHPTLTFKSRRYRRETAIYPVGRFLQLRCEGLGNMSGSGGARSIHSLFDDRDADKLNGPSD